MPSDALFLNLTVGCAGAISPSTQIYGALRERILDGRLGSGARLPASRALAAELGVARGTVISAYDQLSAEGYLDKRRGAGVFVAELPEKSLQRRWRSNAAPRPEPAQREGPVVRAFRPGAPDMRLFPHRAWGKCVAAVWRRGDPALLSATDPLGDWPLRCAIAEHLRLWRGVACAPEQIAITAGAAAGVRLALQCIGRPNESVSFETPCYRALPSLAGAANHHVVFAPIDAEGLCVSALPSCARAVVVTPSRQYPTGIAMSAARRLELLEWAREQDGWIIEDDYDSEYRYSGRPTPALAALEQELHAGMCGRVFYIGTFSKIFSAALRLGYVVAPPGRKQTLADAANAFAAIGSIAAQRPLARFIEEGDFARHIRRMRRVYRKRREALIAALRGPLSDMLRMADFEGQENAAGMNLCVGFVGAAARLGDVEAARRADEAGVDVSPVSCMHFGEPPARQGMLLGFAGFSEEEIAQGAARLSRALRTG